MGQERCFTPHRPAWQVGDAHRKSGDKSALLTCEETRVEKLALHLQLVFRVLPKPDDMY